MHSRLTHFSGDKMSESFRYPNCESGANSSLAQRSHLPRFTSAGQPSPARASLRLAVINSRKTSHVFLPRHLLCSIIQKHKRAHAKTLGQTMRPQKYATGTATQNQKKNSSSTTRKQPCHKVGQKMRKQLPEVSSRSRASNKAARTCSTSSMTSMSNKRSTSSCQ